MPAYLTAFFCVLGLAAGQLLFKAAANQSAKSGSLLDSHALFYLAAAMGLYAVMSLVWVWLLRATELGRIYPVMALAFVLVPLGSHFLYDEVFTARYFAGVALIMAGVFLTTPQG